MDVHAAYFKSCHLLHTIAHVAYCVFGYSRKARAVYYGLIQVYIDLIVFYAAHLNSAALIVAADQLP